MMKLRKSLTKKQREILFKRTNGRCGYCGELLQPRWHADHVVAFVNMEIWEVEESLDNYMASSPQCNNYKFENTIEEFRTKLTQQIEIAKRQSVNYRFALKYKQIKETPTPIIFYFETIKDNKESFKKGINGN